MAAAGVEGSLEEFTLRAPRDGEQGRGVDFLGTFPLGAPKFHDEDIMSTWRVRVDQPLKEKKKKFPRIPDKQTWFLEDQPGHVTHKGEKEGGLMAGHYFVIYKEGSEFVAQPVEQWVRFKPHFEMENALTLEEAENLMNNRHKAGSRIMQKLKVDLAKDDESMKEEKHMRTGVDSDDEEFAVGFTKVKRRDDDDFDQPGSPEKGEDFDFDEVFDNDDDAMVPEDEVEEEEEEVKPKGMKTEEEEQQEEEELDDSGKGLKKILKKLNAEGYEDEDEDENSERAQVKEEEEEDDVDEDEDLDAMANNMEAKATRKTANRVRSATPPQRQTPAPTVSRRTPPPTTKRQAEDDEDVPLAKKMKGPGGSGVAANPTVSKSSETSSSKRDKQVTPEPRSRKPSSADSGGAITRDQVVALLKKFGKLQTADLIKKLKEAGMKLKTNEDKKNFSGFVKEVARMEEDPPGSGKRYVVLRKQFM